jgi:alpha/beta superfamily hydrolase
VVEHAAPASAAQPLALAGFSFGAFVTTHAFQRLAASRDIEKLVLVGTSVTRAPAAPIDEAAHLKTLVVHGEQDDTVLLSACWTGRARRHCLLRLSPGAAISFMDNCPC